MLLCSFVPKTFSSCSLRYRKHFYSPHFGQNGLSYHLDTKELHAFNRLNTQIYHSDKSRDIRVHRQTLRSSSVTENLTRVSCILCTDSGYGKLVFLVGTLPLYRYPLSRTVLTAWTHRSCRVRKFCDNRFRVLHFLWGVLTCHHIVSLPARIVNQGARLLFEVKDGCRLFEGGSWCAPLWTTWAIRLEFKFQ